MVDSCFTETVGYSSVSVTGEPKMPTTNDSNLIEQVAQRIVGLRTARGWSMRKLAREVGMSHSRLQRIESDYQRPIAIFDVARIAQALEVPMTRLLRGSVVGPRVLAAARTQTTTGANATIDRFIEILEIEDQFNEVNIPARQVVDLPRIARGDRSPREWGRRSAEAVRSAWELPSGSLGDLAKIIEEHTGIYVAVDAMPDGVDGISLVDPENGATLIAACTTDIWERQRFTLAHELGHLVAGEMRVEAVVAEGGRSAEETAANEFARNLLLPWVDVVRKHEERGEDPWNLLDIAALAWEYQISPKAAAIQLSRAGFIVDEFVDEVSRVPMNAWSVLGGWEQERQGFIAAATTARRPEGIIKRAREAHLNGLISIRSFARVANQPEEELRQALDVVGIQAVEVPN